MQGFGVFSAFFYENFWSIQKKNSTFALELKNMIVFVIAIIDK